VNIYPDEDNSILNIYQRVQATDKRKTALSTMIFPTYDKKFGELWSTNKKWPLTLKF